jgi:subtilisin family serine protease
MKQFGSGRLTVAGCLVALMATNGAVSAPLCPLVAQDVVPENPCDELPVDPAAVAIAEQPPRDFVPGEFLLRLRGSRDTAPDAMTRNQQRKFEQRIRRAIGNDAVRLRALSPAGLYMLEVGGVTTPEATTALLNRLARIANERDGRATTLFSVVEPVFTYYAQSNPSDPAFIAGQQWGLERIKAPAAWDLLRADDHAVVLAIVDSGVRYQTQQERGVTVYDYGDFAGRLWTDAALPGPDGNTGTGVGANWIADPATGDPRDETGHGTEVAGIAGATVNDVGIAGAAGPATQILLMPVKVLKSGDNPLMVSGSTPDIIQAIDYAVAHGASVINASLGSGGKSIELCQRIRAAGDAGVLVVAAAGNAGLNNDSFPFYPASYPLDNIVSVMASNKSDTILLGDSNHGCESVDLAAPGEDIATPIEAAGQILADSGTSMATPFVSAAAALVRSMNPDWSPAQVRQHLMDTATDGTLHNAANGLLNMHDALISPIQIRANGAPQSATAGTTVIVKWQQTVNSRACPTAYVRLLPAGPIATHDDCSNAATCIELATGVSAGSGQASVIIPAVATNHAYWRVGCDGSGLFSERGPFTVN